MIKIAIAVIVVLSIFSGIIIYNEKNSKESLDIEYTGAKAQPTINSNQYNEGDSTESTTTMKQPKIIIDPNVAYNAKVTTSKGAFTIELKTRRNAKDSK